MILQDKYESMWEAHQTKIQHMKPWRHAAIGDELMGDLLPSGQVYVCKGYAYSEHPQRATHKLSRFCSGLHPG